MKVEVEPKYNQFSPFRLFNRFPNWFFVHVSFFLNTTFTFCEKSMLKVFCACVKTREMHGARSTGRKSCSVTPSTVTCPGVGHSNGQYLLATIIDWHIIGKVHGCFILVNIWKHVDMFALVLH